MLAVMLFLVLVVEVGCLVKLCAEFIRHGTFVSCVRAVNCYQPCFPLIWMLLSPCRKLFPVYPSTQK